MQIPDEIRKCVAFLACRKNSGPEERGTVFFVGYSLPANEAIAVIYAVTARHVIEGLANDGDGNAYCRVNTRQHGVQFLPIPMSQWVFSDDSQVDVAVAPLAFDFKHLDHKVLPLGMFITPEVVAEEQVGIGDDLFFPGLFTQRPARVLISRSSGLGTSPPCRRNQWRPDGVCYGRRTWSRQDRSAASVAPRSSGIAGPLG